MVASVTRGEVDATVELDPERDGQAPVLLEELIAVDEIVKADAGWRAAMARRGITDLDLVRPCPLSAGDFDIAGERGRRMLRVLSFLPAPAGGPLLGAPDRRRGGLRRHDHERGACSLIDHG